MFSLFLMVGLSALAGAFHMVALDHWMPASIQVWRRGWRGWRSFLWVTLLVTLHVGGGVALYFALSLPLRLWAPHLMAHSPRTEDTWILAFVLCLTFMRGLRFSKIQNSIRSDHVLWGSASVLSLMGPSESLVLVMLAGNHMGQGLLTPVAGYLVGTLVSGIALVRGGAWVWNRPMGLPMGIGWTARPMASTLPVAGALALGLSALILLS